MKQLQFEQDGGTWFTFLGKGNANDLEIKENAERLTAFVQNTRVVYCIKLCVKPN
jgi:hypothetical protein